MRIVWTITGLLAGLSTGLVILFTLGTVLGVVALLVVLGLGVHAACVPDKRQPVLRSTLLALLLVTLSLVIYGMATLSAAFSDTSGPVEPPDPEALRAAVTTHILDRSPDVYLRAIVYDLLAAALVDRLPDNP